MSERKLKRQCTIPECNSYAFSPDSVARIPPSPEDNTIQTTIPWLRHGGEPDQENLRFQTAKAPRLAEVPEVPADSLTSLVGSVYQNTDGNPFPGDLVQMLHPEKKFYSLFGIVRAFTYVPLVRDDIEEVREL